MNKIAVALLGMLIYGTGYANPADWSGQFVVINADTTITIEHTSKNVSLNHMLYAGKCLAFGKGATLNDIKFSADVNLCTEQDIEKFTSEVSKIGQIMSQTATRGPSYSEN